MLVVNSGGSLGNPIDQNVWNWLASLTLTLPLPINFVDFDIREGATLQTCVGELAKIGSPHHRGRLLIGGAYLEDAVTFASMEALAGGYDVYLLSDLIAVSNKKYARFLWTRLFQAGAVPTTMTQLLLEWAASTTEPDLGARIATFSNSYRQVRI